ncbi:hypothetical protein HNP84_002498 [Thermocatellispora tengchongensis]|uniref:FUSC family protein n=1 Tax=Thermocatellispora tengchongensis TaxID=1073253 RepID=A0A840P6C7_9ACTN|nr:aromatic acid exporter family protein [Thermocatellispora tengchongensis]MBB5132777.1 hypothetical protein [Thermocatellispora tengchongensis]
MRVRPILLATLRAQPTAVFIARLTITAVAAYLLALRLPAAQAPPLLAPLTALLVVQYTLYRTVRTAIERILSVLAGVVIAVLVSATLGFSWWTLGVTIAAALVIGYVARLGDHLLEVPISAMLIFALGAHTPAGALDRILETVLGAATGLVAGLIASPVHMSPAQEAIAELGDRLGAMVDRMAERLAGHPGGEVFAEMLDDARMLGGEIERTDQALSQAEESLRLNLRAAALHPMGIALRSGLETLEHSALTLRGMVRSLADRERLPGSAAVYDAEARGRLADALREVAEIVRAFATLVRAESHEEARACAESLRSRLQEGRGLRDEFAEALPPWTSARSPEWRLHAELLVHLDRLLDLFDSEHRAQARNRRRRPVRRGFPRTPRGLNARARRS